MELGGWRSSSGAHVSRDLYRKLGNHFVVEKSQGLHLLSVWAVFHTRLLLELFDSDVHLLIVNSFSVKDVALADSFPNIFRYWITPQ